MPTHEEIMQRNNGGGKKQDIHPLLAVLIGLALGPPVTDPISALTRTPVPNSKNRDSTCTTTEILPSQSPNEMA